MIKTTETKDDLKEAILHYLKYGQENATSKNRLLEFCGLSSNQTDDRILRLAIKDLRHEGKRIGLSLKKPSGYYLIETADELAQCMHTLKGYCVESAISRRDLKLACPELFKELQGRKFDLQHPGQLSLKL